MIEERNLSNKEIRNLKKDLKNLNFKIVYHKRFLIIWCLLAVIIGTVAYTRLDSKALHYLLIGVVLVYILIGVWVFIENIFKIKKERQNINIALSENKALSINVTSKNYIELSEENDEGVFYLFQVNDDKVLSFGGQDFYPSKRFPNDNFEIVRCYNHSDELVFLDIHVYGKKIAPMKKITGQRKWDLLFNPNYPDPETFTIVDGNINDIESFILS